MKIYFEDGPLGRGLFMDYGVRISKVNAADGPLRNLACLDYIKEKHPDAVIYTNSIFAFSNKYAWNSALKVPEIYIRDENDQWARIDELTNKELRQAHNLAKMYIAGEFYRRDEKLPWEEEYEHNN